MVLGLVLLVVVGSVGGLVTMLLMSLPAPSAEASRDRPWVPQTDPPRFIETLPPVPPARPRGSDLAARPIVVPLPQPRPVRRCGHCRAQGHTRTVCPRLTGALTLPRL